jgi:hypothetical protein
MITAANESGFFVNLLTVKYTSFCTTFSNKDNDKAFKAFY